jgi:hypothetical protein
MLRDGLSNRQIAERLGISHRAARYHVSEILSRLGVADREEAARWTPKEDEIVWWRKAVAFLPITMRIAPAYLVQGAGVAIVLATLGGLGLLAIGVLRTQSEGDAESLDQGRHLQPITPTPTLIPGLIYDIVYRVSDGTLKAHGSHMPDEAVSAEAGDGEALLQLTEHPELAAILNNGQSFYVDTATMEIKWRPGRPCDGGDPLQGEDPDCPGYAYELVYWEADGSINSFSVYDACGPPYYDCAATKPATILAPGQAWMNIAGDPRVKDLMLNGGDYNVDIETLELNKK